MEAKSRTIVLECSEWDYNMIQDAIALRQRYRVPDGKVQLFRVDDGSNFAAAVLAEVCDQYCYHKHEGTI